MRYLHPFVQPDLVPLPGTYWFVPRYRLRSDYAARWTDKQNKQVVLRVPQDFTCDGSTEWVVSALLFFVPAGFVWLLGIRSDGPHRAAALVHDYLYAKRIRTRAEADYAFLSLCIDAGVAKWRAHIRYFVLRAVGWIWWYT